MFSSRFPVLPATIVTVSLVAASLLIGCGGDGDPTAPATSTLVIDVEPDSAGIAWTIRPHTGVPPTFSGRGDSTIVFDGGAGLDLTWGGTPGWTIPNPSRVVLNLSPGETYTAEWHGEALDIGEFILVPAGDFEMGARTAVDEGYHSDELPLHEVTFSRAFHLGKHEITQRQWGAIMGNHHNNHPGCDDCPVDLISWWDGVIFCNRLSRWAGLTPVYTLDEEEPWSGDTTWDPDADGYRLPTESEWEYAARAGTETRFHSGNDIADLQADGWYAGNSGGATHAVGGKAANAWGFHDMIGNVSELCWDWYGPYPTDPVTDPAGPASAEKRILRGACYDFEAEDCRISVRIISTPGWDDHRIGLRVARNANSTKARGR